MKKIIIFLVLNLFSFVIFAQKMVDSVALKEQMFVEYKQKIDSIEKSLRYETGEIVLPNGIAKIRVPEGFKYLNAEQANYVLSDLWGNPKDQASLGLLVPAQQGVLGENAWIFNVEFEEMGYVEDDDADDINYEELMEELKNDAKSANEERIKQGYEPIEMIGWAAKPFYEKDRKILHWAKEIKFGTNPINTLNYNIKFLGRKGVLTLNAVGNMSQIDQINAEISKVLDIIQYTDGNKYSDFDPDVDKVAAWTLGGLVAGKLLAKVGFFAIILKFWKLILVALAGAGSFLWRFISGKKEEKTTNNTSNNTANNTDSQSSQDEKQS